CVRVGAALDPRVEHSGELDVGAVRGAARDFIDSVRPDRARTDDLIWTCCDHRVLLHCCRSRADSLPATGLRPAMLTTIVMRLRAIAGGICEKSVLRSRHPGE